MNLHAVRSKVTEIREALNIASDANIIDAMSALSRRRFFFIIDYDRGKYRVTVMRRHFFYRMKKPEKVADSRHTLLTDALIDACYIATHPRNPHV